MTTDNEALKLADKHRMQFVNKESLEAFYNEAIQTGRDQLQKESAEMEPVAWGEWDTQLGKKHRLMMVSPDVMSNYRVTLIPQPTMPKGE